MSKNQTSIIPAEVRIRTEKEGLRMTKVANEIEVKSPEQESLAYEALGQIKRAIKTIDEERKKITQPLNQSLKAANGMFKKLSEPFDTADAIIRDKIIKFHCEQEEKARKEQERREKIQNAHEKMGHKTYELEEVKPEVSETTTIVKRWTFEILNLKDVPRDYLILDNAKVREAIRNGIREIPGLRIYQEEGLRI